VRSNAMLVIKGPMRIVGSEGGVTTRNKAALCRCGQSNRKPFCDMSHKACGFRAE
jgi:CDGSH-type Zn-finger protein